MSSSEFPAVLIRERRSGMNRGWGEEVLAPNVLGFLRRVPAEGLAPHVLPGLPTLGVLLAAIRYPSQLIKTFCEYLPGTMCVNQRLPHILNEGHLNRVVDFLESRGVVRAVALVDKYGMAPVSFIAGEIDHWEAVGHSWLKDIKDPGRYIHYLIRKVSHGEDPKMVAAKVL